MEDNQKTDGPDKVLGAEAVYEMMWDLYNLPDFTLTFEAKKQLLSIAARFFETHNDDGSLKSGNIPLHEKLDEVLKQMDRRVTLKCPVCGALVNFKHTLKLSEGVTCIHCPGCSGDFEVDVRKIEDES